MLTKGKLDEEVNGGTKGDEKVTLVPYLKIPIFVQGRSSLIRGRQISG